LGRTTVTELKLEFDRLTVMDAAVIADWRYADEWSTYDIPAVERESSVAYMADPANGYFAVRLRDELVGFCSVGADGQVPGGPYDGSAIDVGAGMRPDLVGRGEGAAFLHEVVAFLRSIHGDAALRATIASWNKRALRAAHAVGFEPRSTFLNPSGNEFTMLILEP
jgi:ribosomal-protein-alanine N-acetyltransferase